MLKQVQHDSLGASGFLWTPAFGGVTMNPMSNRPNYITPSGYRRLREEYEALYGVERPKLVETIAWAAANGDRSENGDYIYGRKKLREVDRRINWLSKRMADARVVDPGAQPERGRIWFGATVTFAEEDGTERTVTLVGEDETDAGGGRISWNSPIGRAIRGGAVGDLRRATLPAGERELEIVAILYPEGSG
jgi:transcription elongation factor GreB